MTAYFLFSPTTVALDEERQVMDQSVGPDGPPIGPELCEQAIQTDAEIRSPVRRLDQGMKSCLISPWT